MGSGLWMDPGPDSGWSWVILSCSWLFVSLTFGICRSGVAGVILVEILAVFDVTREEAMKPFVVIGVFECLGGLASGALTESFDGRILLAACALSCTLALIFCFWATSIFWISLSFGVLFALGESISMTVCFTNLTHFFKKRLSLANSVYLTATPIAGFLLPTLVDKIFDEYGLRGGFLLLGGVISHLLVAAMLFRPRTPRHFPNLRKMNVLMSGKGESQGDDHQLEDLSRKTSLRSRIWKAIAIYKDVLRQPMFYVVTLHAVAVINIFVGFTLTVVDFVMDNGCTRGDGIVLLTIFSACALGGRTTYGLLTDRLRIQETTIVKVGLFLLTLCLVLMSNLSNFHAYCWLVAFMGYSEGCVNSLINILYKNYLGQKGMATCLGLRVFVNGLFGFFRPVIAGVIRTSSGSYKGFFYFLASLSLCGFLLWVCEPLCVRWKSARAEKNSPPLPVEN